MMKKVLFFVVVLAMAMAFSGCDGEEDVGKYPDHGIAGRWKLVKMRVYTTNPDSDSCWSKTETTDYSKENIIFDFQYQEDWENLKRPWTPKRKLVVSGYTPTDLPNELPQDGEYVYQFRLSAYAYPAGDAPSMDRGNLIIENADSSLYFICGAGESLYRGDIDKSTNAVIIGPGGVYPYGFIEKDGNLVTWTKHFVRIGNVEV